VPSIVPVYESNDNSRRPLLVFQNCGDGQGNKVSNHAVEKNVMIAVVLGESLSQFLVPRLQEREVKTALLYYK
jgi:hypothetical protein